MLCAYVVHARLSFSCPVSRWSPSLPWCLLQFARWCPYIHWPLLCDLRVSESDGVAAGCFRKLCNSQKSCKSPESGRYLVLTIVYRSCSYDDCVNHIQSHISMMDLQPVSYEIIQNHDYCEGRLYGGSIATVNACFLCSLRFHLMQIFYFIVTTRKRILKSPAANISCWKCLVGWLQWQGKGIYEKICIAPW